jgi:hypothetical protein
VGVAAGAAGVAAVGWAETSGGAVLSSNSMKNSDCLPRPNTPKIALKKPPMMPKIALRKPMSISF